MRLLGNYPKKRSIFEKKDNQWITIQCGKSTFNLAGLDPEEFPSLPAYQEENFSAVSTGLIREMIEKTVFAASNEESRYHLNGASLCTDETGGRGHAENGRYGWSSSFSGRSTE